MYEEKTLNEQAEQFIKQGVEFHSENKFKKAIESFNKAIGINSNCAEAYYNRGNVNISYNFSEAIEDYTKAIELNPKYCEAYYSRGLLYEIEYNEPRKAIVDYTKAIECDSNKYEAYLCRGNLYWQIEEYNKATNDFLKVLKFAQNPQNKIDLYNIYYKLGRIKAEQDQYKSAAEFYSEAIKQKIYNEEWKIDSYYKRGLCQICCNNFQDAVADLTIAIEFVNKNVETYSDRLWGLYDTRSTAYMLLGEEKKSEEDFKMAENFKKDDIS